MKSTRAILSNVEKEDFQLRQEQLLNRLGKIDYKDRLNLSVTTECLSCIQNMIQATTRADMLQICKLLSDFTKAELGKNHADRRLNNFLQDYKKLADDISTKVQSRGDKVEERLAQQKAELEASTSKRDARNVTGTPPASPDTKKQVTDDAQSKRQQANTLFSTTRREKPDATTNFAPKAGSHRIK